MTEHLAVAWERVAAAFPEALALCQGEREITYAEFDARASRLASGLRALGIGRGSRLGIDLYNSPEFLETFYAAAKLGVVPVLVNYRYLADELVQLFGNAQLDGVVYHAQLAPYVERAATRVPTLRVLVHVEDGSGTEPAADAHRYEQLIASHDVDDLGPKDDDGYFLAYTGGTTGLPKGIRYSMTEATARSLRLSALAMGEPVWPDAMTAARHLQDNGTSFTSLPAAPFMHTTGLGFGAMPALTVGGTVVALCNRSFDAGELLTTIERRRVTAMTIVGDAFGRPIVQAIKDTTTAGRHADLASVTAICSAGVAWSAETKRAMLRAFPNTTLFDACGTSEGVTYGTSVIRHGDEPSTARFQPAPGVVVLRADGSEAAPREIGLLAAPTFASQYHNDSARGAVVFMEREGVRYAAPGDYGRIEADGALTLIGRGTSVVNSGGEKIFPEEVEQTITQVPGVGDCVVLGTDDPRFGQVVTAVVSLEEGAVLDPDDILAHCRAHLADYKRPRRMCIVDTVPRLPTGKPDFETAKRLAMEQLADGAIGRP